jgi:hypothetical protein
MSMLPRMKPARFYDLVIEVAIVRPGPIQGDMVHPYLRRREGKEKPEYPKPELRAVLEKTLGVPLFQEQAMKVAIVGAGFTPAEADQLRRAMATFKLTGGVSHFYDKLVGGMVARGYPQDFAERTFKQIEGFGSYGFPESHAASFAKIAYASCWVKHHHPDVFYLVIFAGPTGNRFVIVAGTRDTALLQMGRTWPAARRRRILCVPARRAGRPKRSTGSTMGEVNVGGRLIRSSPLASGTRVKPFPHSVGDELGTIVGSDMLRRCVLDEQVSQHVDDVVRPEPPQRHHRQAFLAELVDDVEHPTNTSTSSSFAIIYSGVNR